MECLALLPLFSAQCIQLSYPDFAIQSWADNQGSCRGLQLAKLQGLEAKVPRDVKPWPSIWKNGFEQFVSVCLGFCVDDPNLRA